MLCEASMATMTRPRCVTSNCVVRTGCNRRVNITANTAIRRLSRILPTFLDTMRRSSRISQTLRSSTATTLSIANSTHAGDFAPEKMSRQFIENFNRPKKNDLMSEGVYSHSGQNSVSSHLTSRVEHLADCNSSLSHRLARSGFAVNGVPARP